MIRMTGDAIMAALAVFQGALPARAVRVVIDAALERRLASPLAISFAHCHPLVVVDL